jgi:hypothetical protein
MQLFLRFFFFLLLPGEILKINHSKYLKKDKPEKGKSFSSWPLIYQIFITMGSHAG